MQPAVQHTGVFKISDFLESYLETGENGESMVIGPEGGLITVTDPASPIYGTSLNIPKGALDAPVRISITSGEHTCDFGLSPSLKLFPDGLKFKRPATLTIRLQQTSPERDDVAGMIPAVYQYDDSSGDWALDNATRIERFGESMLCELNHL